jgi:hydrogenase maturation protease
VGNILVRDEGVGVRVVEAMRQSSLPAGVELFDGGTTGVDLIDVVAQRRKVIVIDALQAGEPPGTIFRFTPTDLAEQRAATTSLHQAGFLDVLMMTRQLGCPPEEVVIFGIQPKELGWGVELTPEVAASVPKVMALVQSELRSGRGTFDPWLTDT